MRGAGAVVVLLAACTGPARPRDVSAVRPDAGPAIARTRPDAAACPDPAADALRRAPGAERLSTLPPDVGTDFDPDGDGRPDPVFRDCGGARTCDFLIYGCGAYLGSVRGWKLSEPWCVEPATGARPCTISIDELMIHGESQEYFYELVDGAYTQTGSGKLVGRGRD